MMKCFSHKISYAINILTYKKLTSNGGRKCFLEKRILVHFEAIKLIMKKNGAKRLLGD